MFDNNADAPTNIDEKTMGAFVRAYIGPNASLYERYIAAQSNSGSVNVMAGWCWGAFVSPLAWLLYRKLYMLAALHFSAACILLVYTWYNVPSYIPLTVLISLHILAGIYGKSIYVRIARSNVLALTQAETNPKTITERIKATGGVSMISATIGAIAYLPAYLVFLIRVALLVFALTY